MIHQASKLTRELKFAFMISTMTETRRSVSNVQNLINTHSDLMLSHVHHVKMA